MGYIHKHENQEKLGGYVLTSVMLPLEVAKQIKKVGIGYRGLIMRGLKALTDDEIKIRELQDNNSNQKRTIEKMSLRLEEMALEAGRFKRELEDMKK